VYLTNDEGKNQQCKLPELNLRLL